MSLSVLIVDDSLTVRMDLVDAMQQAGFRTTACETGREAREALGRERFDLVILDLILPDADGIELLREIRSGTEGRGLPVMLLSTEAEVGSRIRGLMTGADEFIGKPYDRGYVVARARELLRRAPVAGGGKPTVLIIDDSPTFRNAIGGVLEAADFRVVTAGTGEEGLRVAAEERPNAIVVDGVLPGIDGPTVIRRIRLDAALRRTPCLLLTASEEDLAELQALEAGADAFVRKEEDVAVILARLNAVLRSAEAPAEEARTASGLSPKRILAVDDSETYLQYLGEMLRAEGYEPILARSGEEALELLAIQSTDCILLDVMMPGLGGHETCRRIKAAPGIRETPLILLTALEDREAMLQGLGVGADDYIAKSSDPQVLKARVSAQIRRRQFEDENRRIRQHLRRSEAEATAAKAAHELAEVRAGLLRDLEWKNQELEAFSYSVSHDLRAPLRSIDGFSRALLEDCRSELDAQGKEHVDRILAATGRMGRLIDDLLELSRVGRAELRRESVDLSSLARSVAAGLVEGTPGRSATFEIAEGLLADCDPRLLRVVFENLLGNAWKFTAKAQRPRIELGVGKGDRGTYFIRDNGAGFDAGQSGKLFAPFQRFHSEADFPGTGIGLATVRRIVDRHGGRIWAESKPGEGATFFFTLPADPADLADPADPAETAPATRERRREAPQP